VQKIAYQSLRTTTGKALAQASLAAGQATQEEGSLAVEQRVAIKEQGLKRWTINGTVLAKNQVVEWICRELARGESLVATTETDGAPSVQEFVAWTRENMTFKEAYEKAKEVRAIVLSERALTRAHGATDKTSKGDTLYVETCKWMAGKLNPKEFGEKQIHEIQDAQRHLPTEQLEERLVAALLANPGALEKLAPKLQEVLPANVLARLEEKAIEARQDDAIPGEKA